MDISNYFYGDFKIINMVKMKKTTTIHLKSEVDSNCCPVCSVKTYSKHSSYTRKVADASIFGNNVQLLLEANKFFCKNSKCSRHVFTERFSKFINTYGRITCRLEDLLSKLSFELSAEKLAKLSNFLGVNRSADYFIRLIRKISKERTESQSIHIGVDDFAFRKGVSYGTLVCDLDTRKPIDLINSRNTVDFKDWLLTNPQIKIVSRDRATTYTKAISEVNPTIIQISDKWHVMKNLLDIVKEIISHEFPNGFYETAKINTPKKTHTIQLTDKQKTKWKVISNVKKLHAEGNSERAISKATGLHRKTVSKYLKLEHAPQRKRISRKSMLDEYREHIKQCILLKKSAKKIYSEIIKKGSKASFSLLRYYIYNMSAEGLTNIPKNNKIKLASRFKVISLFWKKTDTITCKELTLLNKILEYNKNFTELYICIQLFRNIFVNKNKELLETWISTNIHSNFSKIKNYAIRLKKDMKSIENSLDYAYTNGILEGNVNRVKTIKRIMYGRANFDLLKAKVLHSLN
jgi:transposase